MSTYTEIGDQRVNQESNQNFKKNSVLALLVRTLFVPNILGPDLLVPVLLVSDYLGKLPKNQHLFLPDLLVAVFLAPFFLLQLPLP